MKSLLLEFASNYVGLLPVHLKSAIYNYLEFPNTDNWNEIYPYVISTGKVSTIWQAVCEIDPTFPKNVPHDINFVPQWSRIPSPELVRKAIANVVYNSNVKPHNLN